MAKTLEDRHVIREISRDLIIFPIYLFHIYIYMCVYIYIYIYTHIYIYIHTHTHIQKHTISSFSTIMMHYLCNKNIFSGASLVVQWLRLRLPMQGTRVRALVWEDPHMPRSN